MIIAVCAAVIVLLVVAGVLADRHWPTSPPEPPVESLIESRMRNRVVLTLTTGEVFAGVLWEVDDKVWVLRSAQVLAPERGPVPVDGELVILATNVAYANKP